MMRLLIEALLWFSAIGCGLLAGLYFAFSVFIMSALANLPQGYGMVAMVEINRVILRSSFLPLFLGTTLSSLILAIAGALRWGEPAALAMLLGGILYAAGMFGCTMAFNVPLNNELERAAQDVADRAPVWARYVRSWTRWNHVRTVASTIASGLFIAALQSG